MVLPNSVRKWLFLTSALLILGGVLGSQLYFEYNTIAVQERERLATQAKVVDENLNQQLIATNHALDSIRRDLATLKTKKDRITLLNRLQSMRGAMPSTRAITIFDANGTLIARSPDQFVGQNFSNRGYFQAARQGGNPATLYVAPPFLAATGEYVLNVSKVLTDDRGAFAGVILVSLGPEYFRTLLKSVLYTQDMLSSLIHGDGKVIFRVPDLQGITGMDLAARPGAFFIQHMKSGQTTSVFKGIVASTGEARLNYFRTIRTVPMDKPLVIVVSREMTALFAPWRKDFFVRGGLFVLLILATVLGLYSYQQRQRAVANQEAERKRMAVALQESEATLRAIFESSVDAIGVSKEGVQTFMNRAYLSLFGYSITDELINQPVLKLIAPTEHETILTRIRSHAKGEVAHSQYETRGLRKDGTEFDMDVHVSTYEMSGETYSLVILRDITDRKRMEDALRESEKSYRTLIENSFDVVFTLDAEGTFLFVSPAWERHFGYPVSEVIGENFMPFIHPDDVRPCIEYLMVVLKTGQAKTSPEYRVKHADGSWRWFIANGTPYVDLKGQRIFMGTGRDITERKLAEEENQSLQERLQRSGKMEALGTLAGGVAHDLNNVLGVIVGYSEIILDQVEKSSPLRRGLENVMSGGLKAAAIVDDLLTLARRGVQGRSIVNLNKIVAECQKSPELANLSSHHPSVKIITDLETDLLNISGSSVHLGKSLYNLISNASEAMPKGGTVAVKTTNQYLDKPILGYDQIRAGEYVELSISDTGEGISENDLKRIFEPFYTKKMMGRSGTGLGLAVVWGTVKDHNGYINVDSAEGKGSTFTLYFPVTREEITTEAAAAIPTSEYMGKGETILVVDDVKEQRDLASSLLTNLNYNVKSVSSGEEAVEHLKEHKVDLLVLDMIMDTGMDGLDTYQQIINIRPKQQAIIVSGFSESDRVKEARSLGAGSYVRKPYIKEKLGLAVRKELDRK